MPSELIWKDFIRIFGNNIGGNANGVGSEEMGGKESEGEVLNRQNKNSQKEIISESEKNDKNDDDANENELSFDTLNRLKHGAWLGNYFSSGLRGLCWRVMIGKLSCKGIQSWSQKIPMQIQKYENYKETLLPDINRVQGDHDPLSGISSGSGEWAQYSKDLELISFIKGDLERLYMNGVSDEYFKTERRQGMLLNILFIWSQLHPQTSYRQGMHEIVAPFLLVLEQEREEWSQDCDPSLISSPLLYAELSNFGKILCGTDELSQEATLEAETYWLFDRIMIDLEPLYSPVTGADEQPAIVHFCTKIQEHMLRGLDPPLCSHLEENFIQAQLYGMRWSRLLLGREFELTETSLLRIWDYMFACMFDASLSARTGTHKSGHSSHAHASLRKQHPTQKDKLNTTQQPPPQDNQWKSNNAVKPPPSDPLSGALDEDSSHNNNEDKEEESHLLRRDGRDSDDTDDDDDDDILWTTSSAVIKTSSRFGPTSPLLDALSDFMLAMLLHIRDQLIQGDSSSTMFLLMRYPQVHDVTPIVDLADMIRRGVLDTGAHIGATMNRNEVFDLPSFDPLTDKYRVDTFASQAPQSSSRSQGVDVMRKPSWLLGLGSGGQSGNYHNNSQKDSGSNRPRPDPASPTPSTSGLGYLEGGLRRVSMTLSAVGSAVFSSSDDQQSSSAKPTSHSTPKRNSKTERNEQQLSPVLSPALSPNPSSVGGVHDSNITDLSFTPPHPYTQLNIFSNDKKNHPPQSHSHSQPLGDVSLRCHGVSEKLHHLATSLEHWTNLVLNSSPNDTIGNGEEGVDNPLTIQRVKDHLIPDMVSRLRYLSGALEGTIDLNDYDELFGGDSLGSSDFHDPDLNSSYQRNDESIISATSTLTPSRPMNSSRLISRAYDSDDSSIMPSSPAPPTATAVAAVATPSQVAAPSSTQAIQSPQNHLTAPAAPSTATATATDTTVSTASNIPHKKEEFTLNDWVGSGREDPSARSVDDFGAGDNISPIQILYSKPTKQSQTTHSKPSSSLHHPR